ncbi:hypothetical protein DSECCO2_318970 [anaerobic digester metagenome]
MYEPLEKSYERKYNFFIKQLSRVCFFVDMLIFCKNILMFLKEMKKKRQLKYGKY